jgi:glycosyltransferase involved in cell wall biosynthesis
MPEIDTPMCLSVVMPCFNEQQFITECVNKVLASPFVGQLIIVDDGSTDGTRDLLRQLSDPRVEVHFNETNMGKGSSLAKGFKQATKPFVLVQDADLEYDPDEYGMLLAPLLKNKADVVFGSRFTGSGPHRVLYFWHYIANKLLTLLSNAFTNLNLTDMETCYKCFRLEVIQSIQLNEKRFGIEPEITSKISKGNWRVYEVGISYSGRTYDEGKKIGLKDAFRAVYCILKYR